MDSLDNNEVAARLVALERAAISLVSCIRELKQDLVDSPPQT